MYKYSFEELIALIRKIEFNKTEPELLMRFINKAIDKGELERDRLKRISKKSRELFEHLEREGCFCRVNCEGSLLERFKETPIGGVDGSFQVAGGIGGKWYVFLGFSQIIAKDGFTVDPLIGVDGDIQDIEAVDEGDAHKRAELLMMLGEIKSLRKLSNELDSEKEPCIIIDGPIIDPPTYAEERYVNERVDALRYCCERNVDVVGFVKRVTGNSYLNYLKNRFQDQLGMEAFAGFVNDFDFLSTIMFEAVKKMNGPVYTYPVSYDESGEAGGLLSVYKCYKEKGERKLTIYYSYYKPFPRAKVFRVEYVSFEELDKNKLREKFEKIMGLIKLWTLPGMSEPLPIILAHNKCTVRRGAAETLYYEIIARALSEGILHYSWLELERV